MIWRKLRSLLTGKPAAPPAPLPPPNVNPRLAALSRRPAPTSKSALGPFDHLKPQVEAVLVLDLSTPGARDQHGGTILTLLRDLDTQIEIIRQRASGYPSVPIMGDVWMAGAAYAGLTAALSRKFNDAGWLEREENATALWAKSTLAVCSHYHHLVGPAMLANADCHDRLGNPARATSMYQAVVTDFVCLLDEADADAPDDYSDGNDGVELDNEQRVALESLATAASRLLSRGITHVAKIDLTSTQARTTAALNRGKAPSSD